MDKYTRLIKVLFFLYFITLTWCLLKPMGQGSLGVLTPFYNDKVTHITAFCILTLLGIFAFPGQKVLMIALLGTCYGILIEFLQKYMNLGRTFEAADILSDFIGCLAAVTIVKIILYKKQKTLE